ncbi:hypothetical protein C8R46DRAFT_516412 [Mycena filopes]|nr:hypothetical protein C8R46DRAFT_516412 [Mycena filopes]
MRLLLLRPLVLIRLASLSATVLVGHRWRLTMASVTSMAETGRYGVKANRYCSAPHIQALQFQVSLLYLIHLLAQPPVPSRRCLYLILPSSSGAEGISEGG